MNRTTMKKNLIAAAASALAICAFASSAAAAPIPTFTINSGAVAPTFGSFIADFVSGNSTELVHTTSATTHVAQGYLLISSYSLGGVAIDNDITGLGTAAAGKYQLYITFQLADTYRAGTGLGAINTPNSINDLTKLDFQVWADPNRDTVLTQATTDGSGNGVEAKITGNGNDILLGFGDLISGINGFNDHLGAYANSTENFAVCSGANTALVQGKAPTTPTDVAYQTNCASNVGTQYFAQPNPFFGINFTEFNNTGPGATINADGTVTINQASGGVDFAKVPEPGTLALLGLGLLGLSATGRRRAK